MTLIEGIESQNIFSMKTRGDECEKETTKKKYRLFPHGMSYTQPI